jgi:hypothetical protein
MSDQQTFLLVLLALYLSECVSWVRRGGAVFRTCLGRRWSLALHSGVIANDRGDLHWHWPLPPLGTVHVLRVPPLALTPEGILSGTTEVLPEQGRPRFTGQWIPWAEVKSAHAENKRLFVNGARFWDHDSAYEPLRWAKDLPTLAALPPAEREAQIRRRLADAFDRTAFDAARAQFNEVVRPVRRWSLALFALLFVVAPLVVWCFGLLPALVFLVVALVALLVGTGRSFLRAHRTLYPAAGDERFRLGILLALAPFSAVRAPDVLARAALERFHPLVGAFALLPRPEALALARRVWRDLKFPLRPEFPSADPAAVAAARWFREQELAEVEGYLVREGVLLADLAAPLAPSEPENTQHCERCEAQFLPQATGCVECGGRALVPLPTVR